MVTYCPDGKYLDSMEMLREGWARRQSWGTVTVLQLSSSLPGCPSQVCTKPGKPEKLSKHPSPISKGHCATDGDMMIEEDSMGSSQSRWHLPLTEDAQGPVTWFSAAPAGPGLALAEFQPHYLLLLLMLLLLLKRMLPHSCFPRPTL